MNFNSLEKCSITEITSLFNRAFADYFVKIELTPELLTEKIISEGIQLDKSLGIFDGNRVVGFILHALRNSVAYNAGTGVIPEYRGQNATAKMYNYILPKLKTVKVSELVLEVMAENTQAIKSYEKVGFKKVIDLLGFQGKVNNFSEKYDLQVSPIDNSELNTFETYRDWQPTWQHSTATIQKSSLYKSFGAFKNGELLGYLCANQQSGRVAQFVVKPQFRKQGVATSLFQNFAKKIDGDISVINVDGNAKDTHAFLKKVGLKHTFTQYKMSLEL